MSAKLGVVWEAPPHTIAKIAMVRKYLFVWLSILGARFRGADLWYIDGFAGPGEYTNFATGSPIAALQAADQALTHAKPWVAGRVHCVFIEEDAARFANLEKKLAAFPENPNVRQHLLNRPFVDGLAALRSCAANPFTPPRPLFSFIDPFGVTGLPFATVRGLLSNATSEVLINVDSDGLVRVYLAGKHANHRTVLNETFGDELWAQELSIVPKSAIPKKMLALYRQRLRAIPNVHYVFPFEMQSKAGKMDYHLIFASQHPLGLEKMKEVMKQFSKDGTYVFADDADDSQSKLFRFDEPATHAEDLAARFCGRTVAYSEVNDYALNDSPFTNAKSMLAELEKRDRIIVRCIGTGRRKATFPPQFQATMTIEFKR